jgi:hypothetical protein
MTEVRLLPPEAAEMNIQEELGALMLTCCRFLDDLVASMGKRGLSVVLKSEMGFTFFCLQCRAVDAIEAEQLATGGTDGSVGFAGKVRLAEQAALTYCPSCGCKLEDWMRDHPRETEELIQRSRPFVV